MRTIIANDVKEGKHDGRVHTRFPPEPNGYLHIGHAKSICLNFGLAQEFGGLCNLRFDDTNPAKEDVEYVNSIMEDVRWLGFDWDERLFYASNYFEKLYQCALRLIEAGKAFVCDLDAEAIRLSRGTLNTPGENSPYRERTVEENLALFQRMRAGEFADGTRVLRAKINMASPNLNLRDPVLYRILHVEHHRTGDAWSIYPMYDFAHPLSDAFEGITHSICTMEFEDHRPLYDWLVEALFPEEKRPRQYEFARLNVTHTMMSKRKLRRLVEEGVVQSWDDPRMPTISGLRRRGYTPAAIRDFCERIGVARAISTVDIALLEHCLREDLNAKAQRVMAVLKPLKLVLTNYPEGKSELLRADNNPEDPEAGSREIPFARELYIEQDDFMEDPPRKFFRLKPGGEVRLKHAYIIQCERVIKDEAGNIQEVHCTYDPDSKSGGPTSGRKVKGTLHWVAANTALPAEYRLYDHLFLDDAETEQAQEEMALNPDSLQVWNGWVEPSLGAAQVQDRFQFLRQGYFCVDSDSQSGTQLVFNRIVGLRDSFKKALPAQK